MGSDLTQAVAESLGLRLYNSLWWSGWMLGMRTIGGGTVCQVDDGWPPLVVYDSGRLDHLAEGDIPDLRSPATNGCVLEMVRTAWGRPTLTTWWADPTWDVDDADGAVASRATSEAEALLAALVNAPYPKKVEAKV